MDPWRDLLELAILSPSPHNVQPWRVRIRSPREAELWIERRRTLPREDSTGSFILLTMALFVEALRLVADSRGIHLTHELTHEPEWYRAEHLESLQDPFVPFARLTLERAAPAQAVPAPDALLRARRTSRLAYSETPVSEDARATLVRCVERFGHRYGQTTNPATIEFLLRANVDAVFKDLNTPAYHDEIASWFRLTRREAERTRDGLDARCMSASWSEMWIAKYAPALLRLPALRHVLARRYRTQIGPVTTMGWLAGGFWEPTDALVAGRALLHFWLEVTRLGLVIHPSGNLVTNRPAAARCAPLLGVEDAWLVFKIGRSESPPASLRRGVEEVLLD